MSFNNGFNPAQQAAQQASQQAQQAAAQANRMHQQAADSARRAHEMGRPHHQHRPQSYGSMGGSGFSAFVRFVVAVAVLVGAFVAANKYFPEEVARIREIVGI